MPVGQMQLIIIRLRACISHRKPVAVCGLLAGAFFCLLFSACASAKPRVTEVSSTKRTQSVEYQDKRQIFLQDRASRLHFEAEPLPPDKQRQEFYVRWTGEGVALVKFEYRQAGQPNTILVQTFKPLRETTHIFYVGGDEFATGGSVSAWQVSLCANTTGTVVIANKKSALW